ncbi:MAG: putative DNA binding domain-containing protein [Deltaproteobacteria bacterium]|nr:putative DNA binding domain-containing protein [Deltaproteobacteria bacterium]
MNISAKELSALLSRGEGESLEFKRSTGELKEAMKTLCAFMNGTGGTVLFGIRPDGTAEGQDISDKTLREIAQAAERFEPAVHLLIRRAKVKAGREVVAVSVEGGSDKRPFTYDGRPYERVGSSTRRMAQSKYEKALLDRAHATRRWENEPAERVGLRDIDRDEVFRIVNIAASLGRLSGPVGTRLGDVLDRLKLRRDGKILQAAVVLFGKEFMPDYPQCELRMARFRGTDKTEFLDQRQVRAPAFKLLEEAELFCQRHFPMPAKIVPGRLRRVEAPLIPVDAMREILVNALIHRDYPIAGGSISLAIFDDRVEVWSAGAFPTGITPEQLSRSHLSVQRNPIIADVFNRAGLIEKWGRGTNRVIAMCREAGISPPTFEEIGPAALVTFRVPVGTTTQVTGEVTAQVTAEVTAQVAAFCRVPRTAKEIMADLGLKHWKTFQGNYLIPLIEMGILERTIPDKPRSSKQRYRLTEKGRAFLDEHGG